MAADIRSPSFCSRTHCKFVIDKSVWGPAALARTRTFESWRKIVYQSAHWRSKASLSSMITPWFCPCKCMLGNQSSNEQYVPVCSLQDAWCLSSLSKNVISPKNDSGLCRSLSSCLEAWRSIISQCGHRMMFTILLLFQKYQNNVPSKRVLGYLARWHLHLSPPRSIICLSPHCKMCEVLHFSPQYSVSSGVGMVILRLQ